MDIRSFVDAILNSKPTDWLRVDAPALTAVGHDELLTLKDNLSVSIASGAVHMQDYPEDWARSFPDASASSEYVDLLYNGMVIHREIVVLVDGGRCSLPQPLPRTSEIPRRRYEFVRIIQALTNPTGADYDDYVKRAGLTPVDAPWLANPLEQP